MFCQQDRVARHGSKKYLKWKLVDCYAAVIDEYSRIPLGHKRENYRSVRATEIKRVIHVALKK